MDQRAIFIAVILLLVACTPAIFATQLDEQRPSAPRLTSAAVPATQSNPRVPVQHVEPSLTLSDTIQPPVSSLELPGGLRSYLPGPSNATPADSNLLRLYFLLAGSRLSR